MPKANKVTSEKVSPFKTWLNDGKDTQLVNDVNQLLLQAKGDVSELKIPVFGSSLYDSSDTDCVFHNADSVIASVVADRFIRKFERPSRDAERLLKRKCVEGWIDFEASHLDTVERHVQTSQPTNRAIIRSRKTLKEWLRPSKSHQKSFWDYIEEAPVEFGPGESFTGSQGDTSVFSKINPNQIFPYGTVSVELAAFAAIIIASNKATRTQYLAFLRKKGDDKYPSVPCKQSIEEARKNFPDSLRLGASKRVYNVALRIYSEIFHAFPLDHEHCLIKRGSRGSSVYKDSEKRRFINIECLWDSVIQKMVGFAFRQCLKFNARIDLDDGQQYHRYLISKPVTTVDESNASDSIVHKLCQKVLSFDSRLVDLLDVTRASFILLDVESPTGRGTFAHQKSWFPVKKTSSMGNGYTFELLSLLLGSLVRYHDSDGSVYGDDIICSNEAAEDIIEDIRAAGFIVNQKKSFVNKPFRESCGAFFLDNYGYITCFDIKWCHSVHDVITTVNKFGRIISKNQGWEHPLKDMIVRLYNDLLGKVPAFLRGPECGGNTNLPEWVEDVKFLKRQKPSAICKEMQQAYSKTANALTDQWKLVKQKSNGEWAPDPEWGFIKVLQPKTRVKIRAKYAGLHDSSALVYSYIYSGRVSDMQIRQQTTDLVWEYKTTLVHSSGSAIRAETARRITAPFDKNGHRKTIIRSTLKGKRLTPRSLP